MKKLLTEVDMKKILIGDIRLDYNNDYIIATSSLIDMLNDFGEVDEYWDQNGWQGDYWLSVNIFDEIFTVSGSMFYGSIKRIISEKNDKSLTEIYDNDSFKFEGYDEWVNKVKNIKVEETLVEQWNRLNNIIGKHIER